MPAVLSMWEIPQTETQQPSPSRPVPKADRKAQNAALGAGQRDSPATLDPRHVVIPKNALCQASPCQDS
jgi:hypothetical protein